MSRGGETCGQGTPGLTSVPSCLFQAPHTITVLQPEEPRHLPQPPPMTATDPQSHVGTNSYNAYQSPRQTARPNNSVSHPLSLTLEASSLHFSPPRIQVGLLDFWVLTISRVNWRASPSGDRVSAVLKTIAATPSLPVLLTVCPSMGLSHSRPGKES